MLKTHAIKTRHLIKIATVYTLLTSVSACQFSPQSTGQPFLQTSQHTSQKIAHQATSPVAVPRLSIGKPNWTLDGFEQPESIVYDLDNQQYFVSNISGMPTELNGKGFISRVSQDGKMLDKYWVTGLNAPKGMAKLRNLLFVADMQQLHIIDIEHGQVLQTVIAPKSKMLNDISVDSQGLVYVSDILASGIYRLDSKRLNSEDMTAEQPSLLTRWIAPAALAHPNGLLVNNGQLLVATWGQGMHEDFSTDSLGSLKAIDLVTGAITPLTNAQQIGNLDGLTSFGDHILFNDWVNGNIFSYQSGELNKLFISEKTTADISSDGDNLLLPIMMQNKVISYSLNPADL